MLLLQGSSSPGLFQRVTIQAGQGREGRGYRDAGQARPGTRPQK